MLHNARVTAFTVSELLRENQQGQGKIPPPNPPSQIRLNDLNSLSTNTLGTYSKLNSLSVLLAISTGLPQAKSLICIAFICKRFATDE